MTMACDEINDLFMFICKNTYTQSEFADFMINNFNKALREDQTYKYLIRGRYGNEFYDYLLNKAK